MTEVIPHTSDMGLRAYRRLRKTHCLTGPSGRRYWLKKRVAICEHCKGEMTTGPLGRIARFCKPCRDDYETEKAHAHNAAFRAIRDGKVPPASDFKCEDCPRDAQVYDHRDYREPLLLAPVCKSCNVKRRGALWSGSKKNLLDESILRVSLTQTSDAIDCAAVTLMGAP